MFIRKLRIIGPKNIPNNPLELKKNLIFVQSKDETLVWQILASLCSLGFGKIPFRETLLVEALIISEREVPHTVKILRVKDKTKFLLDDKPLKTSLDLYKECPIIYIDKRTSHFLSKNGEISKFIDYYASKMDGEYRQILREISSLKKMKKIRDINGLGDFYNHNVNELHRELEKKRKKILKFIEELKREYLKLCSDEENVRIFADIFFVIGLRRAFKNLYHINPVVLINQPNRELDENLLRFLKGEKGQTIIYTGKEAKIGEKLDLDKWRE